jgi:hypothetical protein
VIAFPRAIWTVFTLAIAQFMMFADGWMRSSTSGELPDYLYFGAFVAAGVFFSVVLASGKETSNGGRISSAWEYLAPYLTHLLVIALFFAGFAKLNRDYFDLDLSTGAVLYEWLRQNPALFFLHGGRVGSWTGIIAGVGLRFGCAVASGVVENGVGWSKLCPYWFAVRIVAGFNINEMLGIDVGFRHTRPQSCAFSRTCEAAGFASVDDCGVCRSLDLSTALLSRRRSGNQCAGVSAAPVASLLY